MLFVTIYEDLIFRAGLYEKLKDNINIYLATLISALIFGSLHIINIDTLIIDMVTISSILIPTIAGILFTYTYEKHNTIIIPIIAHMINNIITVLITYFDVVL